MKKHLKWVLLVLFLLLGIIGCDAETTTTENTIQLDAPTDIAYNAETNQITWDSTSSAVGFEVYINNVLETTVETNSYTYNPVSNSFSIKLKAVAPEVSEDEYIYIDSGFSEEYEVYFLNQVVDIVLQDGILYWGDVEDADGYTLKINGIETDIVTTNYYDQITPGETQEIYIKAYKEKSEHLIYASHYSNKVTVNVLPSPIINFNSGTHTVFWNAVDGAEGYNLRILYEDEIVESHQLGRDTLDFNDYDFTMAGSYEIMVQATGFDETSNDSKYSQSISIIRLENPSNITTSQGVNENVVNVSFDGVADASTYEIKVDGVIQNLVTINSFEYMFEPTQVETIKTITIQAKGDGQYVLDALQPYEFQLTKLSVPTSFVVLNEYITWGTVSKTNGYNVVIDGTDHVVQNAMFDLKNLEAGNHYVRVQAKGNNEFFFNSDFSNEYRFKKLSAPSNLTITNNVLSWNEVLGATNYQVFIGDNVQNSTTNSLYINNSWITDSTAIRVIAQGNDNQIIDSKPSNNLMVYRLSSPTGLSFTNDNILWNEVNNAEEYLVIINDLQFIVQGTSFSLDSIDTGDKIVKVKALGDNSVYFDSNASNSIGLKKLSEPVLSIVDGHFEWTTSFGAEEYEIRIDDQSYYIAKDVHQFDYIFPEPGEYVIHVRALGDESSTVSSNFSSVTHSVSSLQTVYGTDAVTLTKTNNNLIINITTPIDHAVGYNYNISGIDFYAESLEYVYPIDGSGDINVKVSAVGDGFYYVNSNYSEEKQISILPSVKNIDFTYEQEGLYNLSWEIISDASQYQVIITKKDVNGTIISGPTEFITSDFSIQVLVGADVYSVEVQIIALGDNFEIFNSEMTEEVFIPKGS